MVFTTFSFVQFSQMSGQLTILMYSSALVNDNLNSSNIIFCSKSWIHRDQTKVHFSGQSLTPADDVMKPIAIKGLLHHSVVHQSWVPHPHQYFTPMNMVVKTRAAKSTAMFMKKAFNLGHQLHSPLKTMNFLTKLPQLRQIWTQTILLLSSVVN